VQRVVPSLNIEAGELLQRSAADVRRDLVFDQLPIALRRPGGNVARGFPLGDPRPHEVGQGSLTGLDVERHPSPIAEASKRAVGRLLIQFRVERAAKRVAWFAGATFVVALILSVPGVSRVIVKLMQS
jgi:hypothetical protein